MYTKLNVRYIHVSESRAKKRKNWEEDDFYGSDDDTFLDRTGDIEKKRKLRMQREKKSNKKAESYDSLVLSWLL